MVNPDTIFALSSGRVPAAIAVVRLSGPCARTALEALARRVPEPRRAVLAKLRHPVDGQVLDEALVLWFPAPRSETGEDMAELHLHGGRAVVAAVLAVLAGLKGLRPAEAGEFTRRAFENGRLDLTTLEGLADLIHAETEAQRRQALGQFQGRLAARAEIWRGRLVEALALVEAGIDFSDEADVPRDLLGPALGMVASLHAEIGRALDDDRRGERLRDGLVVAIAGPANAGKSSLLNRLARRDAAIVSPVAGTTRDVIEVHLDLDGFPVTMLDMAGIRETSDPVEREGVRRAQERAGAADLVLWVVDAASRQPGNTKSRLDRAYPMQWLVWNKIDLVDSPPKPIEASDFDRIFRVSAVSGAGLEELVSAVSAWARSSLPEGEPSIVTRERHRSLLIDVLGALVRALAEGEAGRDDLVAEELRLAGRALGRLTGRIDVEDVLDAIFQDFCIGK